MVSTPSRARLALLLVCATAFLAVASGPTARVARAGWWDDLDKGEQVKLSDLTADADRWKGKVVTFACIYHGPDSVYQPYFTSFNAEKFLNFTAWYDGSPIWERQAYLDDEFPYLYLARNHAQRDELLRVPAFTRIEVTGKVKDVYRQRPWIDVQGFRVTAATFGQNVVERMKDGDACAANGDYSRAESYYKLVADQVSLDDTTRLRVKKRLDEARNAAGKGLDPADAGKVLGGTHMPQPADGIGAPGATPTQPLPDDVPNGAVPVTPLAGTDAPAPTARPDALTTDDLPGTPMDNGKGPAALPAPLPKSAPPTKVCPPASPVATGPAVPAKQIAPPPAPALPAPVPAPVPVPAPAPVAADAPAAPPPPPPPPRTPRLSGVK